MTLTFYHSCATTTTTSSLFLNLLFTSLYGIYIPKEDGWLTKLFGKPRDDHIAPFFFKELRLMFLALAILYNLIRLGFESTFRDVSVPLIAVRIVVNSCILLEQHWMCANWHEFFIEKKMRTYLWFRMFGILSLMFIVTGFRECSSYVRWKEIGFYIVGALQFQVWYYWGKGWQFNWGDMRDDRRMHALRNGILVAAFIDIIYFFYSWKVNGFAFTLIIAVFALLFLAGVVQLIIIRDRNNTVAFFKTYASSAQPSKAAVVSPESEQSKNDNENDFDLDLEDGGDGYTAFNIATNNMIGSYKAPDETHDHIDLEDGKERENADILDSHSKIGTKDDNNKPTTMTIDITTREEHLSRRSVQGSTIFTKDNLLSSIDENNSNRDNPYVFQDAPSLPAAAGTSGDTNLSAERRPSAKQSLGPPNVIASGLLKRKSVFIPDCFRESLEQRIVHQNASHLMVDKIATLIPQILIWFMVVMITEVGFIIVYGPPSLSTWQWCNDFIYSNPYTGPQSLIDMIT